MFHMDHHNNLCFMKKPNLTPALETILHTAFSYSPALELVVRERLRQITEEGWLPEHDDGHVKGEMGQAAACYADAASMQVRGVNMEGAKSAYFEGMTGTPLWPFDQESFRLKDDPLRNAIISAALEIAEADRIIRQRAEAQKHGEAK
jgi:hypothetical protein